MTVLGIAALALLFAWLFGGFLLRLSGLPLVFAGAIGLALSGNASSVLVATIGGFLWLLGHGHYALRHRVWKSQVAAVPWSLAGSALPRSKARCDKRRPAGAETREVQRRA